MKPDPLGETYDPQFVKRELWIGTLYGAAISGLFYLLGGLVFLIFFV